MAWLYLYLTGSTEAKLRPTFTTAYNRGNIKMYKKRITKYTAKTVGNGIYNLLGMNMKPHVTQGSSRGTHYFQKGESLMA